MTRYQKSILGRIIVFTAFGAVGMYVAVALLGSIVVDLYGRPPPSRAEGLSSRERTWCIRTLVGLRDELEGQVTLELQHPKHQGDPLARWGLWNEAWVDKMQRAERRCTDSGNPALDTAYEKLAQMHAGYEASVVRMIQTRTRVSGGLREALTALKRQR